MSWTTAAARTRSTSRATPASPSCRAMDTARVATARPWRRTDSPAVALHHGFALIDVRHVMVRQGFRQAEMVLRIVHVAQAEAVENRDIARGCLVSVQNGAQA